MTKPMSDSAPAQGQDDWYTELRDWIGWRRKHITMTQRLESVEKALDEVDHLRAELAERDRRLKALYQSREELRYALAAATEELAK